MVTAAIIVAIAISQKPAAKQSVTAISKADTVTTVVKDTTKVVNDTTKVIKVKEVAKKK